MQVLGHLVPNVAGEARAVSADGNRIIGTDNNAFDAFLWDPQHGMRNLKNVLLDDYGLDLGSMWLDPSAISPDGNVIVGRLVSASGDQAFRIVLPEPSVALLVVSCSILLRIRSTKRIRNI